MSIISASLVVQVFGILGSVTLDNYSHLSTLTLIESEYFVSFSAGYSCLYKIMTEGVEERRHRNNSVTQ